MANADISIATALLDNARVNSRVGAGRAWIALAYSRRTLGVADSALRQIEGLLPLARSAVAAGSARPAESLEVRRTILEIEDAKTAIEADRASAQAQLTRYIGRANLSPSGALPSSDIDEQALRKSLKSNPQIAVAMAQLRQAEAKLDLAQAAKRPDFGVSASYGVRERQYGDVFSVMGTITLPLFAKRRQEPLISAAQSDAAAAREGQEDQVREIRARFESDLAAWRSAERQWHRARDELLPLARDRVKLERASFAAGRAELLDVITAIKALALLEIDILKREERTVAAAAKLRLTYGEDYQ